MINFKYMLENDRLIVKNVAALSRFEFKSDNRICRGNIEIKHRIKVKNGYKRNKNFRSVIPCHKVEAKKN